MAGGEGAAEPLAALKRAKFVAEVIEATDLMPINVERFLGVSRFERVMDDFLQKIERFRV